MSEPSLLCAVLVSSAFGTAAGFSSGLVPGLHINNLAAALTAHAAATLVGFEYVVALAGGGSAPLAVSCFLTAAMVAHMFSEAIPSTYLGIPAGDVVSVLPGHRLAKAGLGAVAVKACARGSLAGVVLAIIFLVPICLFLGPPVGAYAHIREIMGFVLFVFSSLLLASEGLPSLGLGYRLRRSQAVRAVTMAMSVFLVSGALGAIVLDMDYFACSLPDFPWLDSRYVPRSRLLLPMFAGLFGVPTLLLSIFAREGRSVSCAYAKVPVPRPGLKRAALSLLGGAIVGWIPGMTAGSSATLISPGVSDSVRECDVDSSARFIWLYSAVSGSGAVLALGALFVIMRARSGVMDAVAFFMERSDRTIGAEGNLLPIAGMLLAMTLAATLAYVLVVRLDARLGRLSAVFCSKKAAAASLAFVIVLSAVLTGTRGLLLMSTASALGLLPPMLGVRRIQLMGCLLVPVTASFLLGA